MFALLAAACFFGAVVVHGAAFTSHIAWLDWRGLTLLGLLFFALSGATAATRARWRRRDCAQRRRILMSAIPPGGRPVDPAAEAQQLADERAHGPAKVLHLGDAVRVYGENGEVLTGRIAAVVDTAWPDEAQFTVLCERAGDGQQ